MRWKEFKPFLVEFAPPTGTGVNDLQLLSNIVEIVPPTDPLYAMAMSVIKSLVTDIKQEQKPIQPAAPAQQPVEPASQEPVTETVASQDESWYQEFISAINDPQMAARMLKKLRTDKEYREEMLYIHKNSQRKIKAAFTQGGTEALMTVDQFFKDVKKSADLLAGKALGILSTLKYWYENNGDGDVQRPKETKGSLYQKLLYPLENIFQDLGFRDQPPNLRNFKTESPKILKFMQLCQEGIIDFETIIDTGTGNIGDLIPDAGLKEIYDKIFDKLLALDAGQGGGAWGPGELGLSILCRPVSKQKGKGDLVSMYQGEEVGVEVKASRRAESGGRLGGSGVLAGSAGKKGFIQSLTHLCKLANVDVNDIGKNFAEVTKTKSVKGVKSKIGTGELKETNSVASTNMASPRWFESFNRQIPPGLANHRGVNPQGAVAQFLIDSIGAVVSEKGRPYFDPELIASIPEEDGSIDYEKFKQILTRQWYEIYSNTDNVTIILVINPTNGNFSIVHSGEMLTTGETPIVITGGLDFNDSQGKAGPQIGIA